MSKSILKFESLIIRLSGSEHVHEITIALEFWRKSFEFNSNKGEGEGKGGNGNGNGKW
jgi:hypothetical protein